MGKGDKDRTKNKKQYEKNYGMINWGKKNEGSKKYCGRCGKKTYKLEKYLDMILCRDCVDKLKP